MATPTYRLNEKDAVTIWLRHWAGEYQHSIAATFGVNPGRINEVLKGHKFVGSDKIAQSQKGTH